MSMRTIFSLFALTWALAVPAVSGQTLDDAARMAKPDDFVFITDVEGRTVKGRLLSISSASIQLLTPAAVVIPADQVSQIDRLGDPIRDGFRKGAIVGAGFGALGAGATLERKDWVLFFPKVWTGAIEFGLLGMLFDWLHKSRTTLYRAPDKSLSVRMAPLEERGSHGLSVSLRF
jgi:hypothetical protein